MEVYVVSDISLINGKIVAASMEQVKMQDYLEVKLDDGQVVIITASVNGCLKIGIKTEEK